MPRVARAIGRLEGVARAEIDEKRGLLQITPQPAELLDLAAIPPAIRAANSEEMRFHARRVRIVAAGTIEAAAAGQSFRIRAWPFAFPLDAEEATAPGPARLVADVEFGTFESDVARLRLVRQLAPHSEVGLESGCEPSRDAGGERNVVGRGSQRGTSRQ